MFPYVVILGAVYSLQNLTAYEEVIIKASKMDQYALMLIFSSFDYLIATQGSCLRMISN